MNSDRLAFGTAWVRFLLAACGIWLAPLLYPPMSEHRWVFIAYAGVAIVEQFLIWRDIGGAWRPFLGGGGPGDQPSAVRRPGRVPQTTVIVDQEFGIRTSICASYPNIPILGGVGGE